MFDSNWVFHSYINNTDLIRGILDVRQISDTDAFLKPELTDMYNPFMMNDMQKAVDRIKTAVLNKEKIFILLHINLITIHC